MAVLEELADDAEAGAAAPDACAGAGPCAAEERTGDAAPPADADAEPAACEAAAAESESFHDAHEVRGAQAVPPARR